MPTYEYACRSCGEHHDVVQSIGDDPLTECPSCGGPLRKVFGAVGVVFKGSGFYKTDSRSSSKKAEKKTAAADTGGSSTSDSSGSSSTPADTSGSSSTPASTESAKPAGKAAAAS
ncbi:MAG TPA: FmdB family zinc ribbon protein [Acidimicrobiales bacterium]|nr:FmdB family zinc ribbon protein [Acidimicrobiales bacterium]